MKTLCCTACGAAVATMENPFADMDAMSRAMVSSLAALVPSKAFAELVNGGELDPSVVAGGLSIRCVVCPRALVDVDLGPEE